ncbi:hypothetical protein [Halococcus salifodinae]|uniref:Uncharacterized protein n=1 Tax=Halococcus salifodinae DSM 8989 TaxID=1227456 RepID=M0ND84_9EURY|nr:hypothetical protein [Halococcus salifodinae]EMA54650.1 hypothetical protein C450_05130 [Halococcus salifodinae DSM 8989]
MRRRLNESRVGKQRPQASPTGYRCYDRAPAILTSDVAFAAFDPAAHGLDQLTIEHVPEATAVIHHPAPTSSTITERSLSYAVPARHVTAEWYV